MKYQLLFLLIILTSLVIAVYSGIQNKVRSQSFAQSADSNKSVKLGTFDIPSVTPYPTFPPQSQTTSAPAVTGGLITGGPVGPNDPYYCIDDEDPDGCDDQTAFWVPKGSGGVPGTCGTVIEWGHTLVKSLPDPQQFMKATRDSLNPAVSSPNCNYSTGPYQSPDYISAFFVIDAYNLAGYHDLSKTNPSHVRGSDLMTWWNSAEASSKGYTFIPYSPTAIQNHANDTQNLTGCVMFLNLSGGMHVGLVNYLELVDSHGNGIISILQSGVRFIIDRFEVVGWDIKNTPLHQTQLQSVAGFGCHT